MIQQFVRDARKRLAAGAYALEGEPLAAHGRFTDHLGLVAEIKPRSPSEGTLRPGDEVLAAYAAETPDAVSVLTDSHHFAGSIDLLRAAHILGVPTLMKDFIVDEAQIRCAAHTGASAVLLIERILEPARREALVAAAHAHGLQVLLEVFDETDWATASDSAADVIGVNARDLQSLRVDVAGARALLADIQDRPSLALSGIRTIHDRRAAEATGADGVLVGTSILQAADPALALRALKRPLAKVCGITNEDDLLAAIQAEADLVGFVVGARSPRSITVDEARVLAAEAHSWATRSVLVTPSTRDALAWSDAAGTSWVQAPGAVGTRLHLEVVEPGQPAKGACVVDTPSSIGGGTGATHDWRKARVTCSAARGISLVAGGLAADNAPAAIEQSHAAGADASSRLEAPSGRKDHDAVRAFVAAVHGALEHP